MRVELISEKEHLQMLEIFKSYPKLTLQNKGYEYINKNKLTDTEISKIKEVEDILKKSIYGFVKFSNFRLNKDNLIELRIKYNYEGGIPFTGVGYILIGELLNGF